MIRRPQKPPSKSIENHELKSLRFPLYGSPKLDGYRCICQDGAFTSSMKPITNEYIQEILSSSAYNGLDGELIVGKPNTLETFNNTTGPVRKYSGQPKFTYYVFDLHNVMYPYEERYRRLMESYSNLPHVHIVKQTPMLAVNHVIEYELKCVASGYEGAIVRSPYGLYKDGRCTLREGNIFKRKPVEDDEATIIGFEEQMQNLNKAKLSETGNMVRSSHKDNKVGKGTLGKFIVTSPLWSEPFAIGTGEGLTDTLRQEIWDNQEDYIGRIFTYKFQLYGSINAPRQPIFKGFRDPNDTTEY